MIKLVLIRHGESLWNLENRFTGWTDVDLDDEGKYEALHAGHLLRDAGFHFDIVFTSVLKRAIHTAYNISEVMNLVWIPFIKAWQLNERHYGALQGLNKSEVAKQYGDAQVHIWRRSYQIAPPKLDANDARNPAHDNRYSSLHPKQLPLTESLKDTVARVIPYYLHHIVPQLRAGKRVLISAHGNSLRALVKYLDSISDEAIIDLNIPTGVPLVYELNEFTLKPIRHYYLTTDLHIEKQQKRIKNN